MLANYCHPFQRCCQWPRDPSFSWPSKTPASLSPQLCVILFDSDPVLSTVLERAPVADWIHQRSRPLTAAPSTGLVLVSRVTICVCFPKRVRITPVVQVSPVLAPFILKSVLIRTTKYTSHLIFVFLIVSLLCIRIPNLMISSKPYLPKAPPPNAITLGVKASTNEFGGSTNNQPITMYKRILASEVSGESGRNYPHWWEEKHTYSLSPHLLLETGAHGRDFRNGCCHLRPWGES